MADGVDPKAIAILLLIVSILFHYFSYSFTVVAYDYSEYDVSLNLLDLYRSGILIGEWDEHNVTFGNVTWTEFDVSNKTIRTRWDTWILTGKSGFLFQDRVDFFSLQPWVDFRWQNIEGGLIIQNSTIIAQHGAEAPNRTIVRGITGFVVIFSDPSGNWNVSEAVMDTGIVNVIIAEDVAWSSEPDLNSFTSWYLGLVTGSESWGLPDSFSILVRIMSMLGIFSGIFLLSEARRIIIPG
jgi:hypothetical protein